MKNKIFFIRNLIISIIVAGILFSMIIKTSDIKSKIIMIPFIICSLASIGKNIFLIIEKKKYADIFSKLFIIGFLFFWFGFLVTWCYLNIKDANYLALLFSLPFWIVGIYITRKFLLGKEKKERNHKFKINLDVRIVVSVFLVGITLLAGILMTFWGIKNIYESNKISKDYVTTNGYFSDYEIYSSDEDGVTYNLIYTYDVDGKTYSIKTDYGASYIPETNSVREIKYNPNNPEQAMLVGTNSDNMMLFMGCFFTFVSMIFVLIALQIKGYFDKFKIDVIRAYIGIVFCIIGIGSILLQNGLTSSFIETIKSFGFWILIPIMFIIVGIDQTIKSFFNKTKNMEIKSDNE